MTRQKQFLTGFGILVAGLLVVAVPAIVASDHTTIEAAMLARHADEQARTTGAATAVEERIQATETELEKLGADAPTMRAFYRRAARERRKWAARIRQLEQTHARERAELAARVAEGESW